MSNKKLLFTSILIAFVATAILGIALSASLEENGQIVNCIFSSHESCPALDHISEWQQVFNAGYNLQANLLFLLGILSLALVAIEFIRIENNFVMKFVNQRLYSTFRSFPKYITQANL